MRIEESLKIELVNCIDFANDILKKNQRNRDEPKVNYNLIKYKKKGLYKILEDVSKHVILVQFMDSLGNVNDDISVVGNWIFDSNYEKALVFNMSSLYMICAPSFGE